MFWASDLPTGLSVNTNTGDIAGYTTLCRQLRHSVVCRKCLGSRNGHPAIDHNEHGYHQSRHRQCNDQLFVSLSAGVQVFAASTAMIQTSHAVVASPSLMSVTALKMACRSVRRKPPSFSGPLTAVRQGPQGVSGSGLHREHRLDRPTAKTAMAFPTPLPPKSPAPKALSTNSRPTSQIGVYEFHRDDEAPQQVHVVNHR